jgi:hypothetical protein
LLSDEQETVVRALERVRSILGECIAGGRDAAWAVERLQATLGKPDVESVALKLIEFV